MPIGLTCNSTSAVSTISSENVNGGDRLVVTDEGLVKQRGTGKPFLAKGINFGMRLTPKPPPAVNLYNASDPVIAQKLLPGMNLTSYFNAHHHTTTLIPTHILLKYLFPPLCTIIITNFQACAGLLFRWHM